MAAISAASFQGNLYAGSGVTTQVNYSPRNNGVDLTAPGSASYELSISPPPIYTAFPVTVSLRLVPNTVPIGTADTAASYVSFSTDALTFESVSDVKSVTVTLNVPASAVTPDIINPSYSYSIYTDGWGSPFNGAAASLSVNVRQPPSPPPRPSPPIVGIDYQPPIITVRADSFPLSLPFSTTAATDTISPPLSSFVATLSTSSRDVPVSLDFEGWGTANVRGNGTLSIPAPGTYTVSVSAANSVGSANATATYTIVIGTDPPVIRIVTPIPGTQAVGCPACGSFIIPATFSAHSPYDVIRTFDVQVDGIEASDYATVSGLGTPDCTISVNYPTALFGVLHVVFAEVTDTYGDVVTATNFMLNAGNPSVTPSISGLSDGSVITIPYGSATVDVPFTATLSALPNCTISTAIAQLNGATMLLPVAGLSTPTATINGPLSGLAPGNYVLAVSGTSQGVGGQQNIAFTVQPPPIAPTGSISPQGQAVSIGATVNLAVNPTGTPPFRYQWFREGMEVVGATDADLAIAPAQITDSGNYSVRITNTATSILAGPARVDVLVPPSISAQPQSQSVVFGAPVSFSVSADGSALRYQWQLNGQPIPGATQDSYSITSTDFTHAGNYSISVTNAVGSVTSDSAALVVFGAPSLTAISPNSAPAGFGDVVVTITGSGFAPTAVALWNGTSLPTSYVNAATLQATIPAGDLQSSTDLATATIAVENPGGFVSTPVAFTIVSTNVNAVNATAVAPSASTTVATVSSSADPVTVSTTLQNNSATASATVAVAAYNQAPDATPAIDVGGQYVDVQVLGADPNDVATSYFYYGASITGTAETDVALQYFDGAAWQPVLSSGGVAPTKDTTDNLDGTTSGGRFTVVFDATSTPQVTQLTGTVFATAPAPKKNAYKEKPKIVSDPASITVKTGATVTLSVSATSVTAVKYQWYQDGKKTPIAGATSSRLTLTNVSTASSDNYYVVVTNVNGSTNSKKANVSVVPNAPAILSGPQSLTVNSGASVTLAVTATGEGTLSYAWQFNGKAIAGANKATYTIANAAQANAGAYTVVVTNAGGSTTSNSATLTVNAPSIASLNPTTVVSGGAAFTLTVSGSNFVNGDVVHWAGDDLTTTFVDANTLRASVPKNELTPVKTAKTVAITVRAAGGDTSNSATVTIAAK